MKFDTLIEKYYKLLSEADNDQPPLGGEPVGDVAPPPSPSSPPMGAESPVGEPPPSEGVQSGQEVGNKDVSQGYAHLVNIIYNLFKYEPRDLDDKYLKYSNVKISKPVTAKKFIEILSGFLPKSMELNVNNSDLGENDDNNEFIDLDDSKLVEMAQIALFFSSKDSLDFYSKLDDVDNILSSTGNKVTVKNAFSVYTEIKNFVAVE